MDWNTTAVNLTLAEQKTHPSRPKRINGMKTLKLVPASTSPAAIARYPEKGQARRMLEDQARWYAYRWSERDAYGRPCGAELAAYTDYFSQWGVDLEAPAKGRQGGLRSCWELLEQAAMLVAVPQDPEYQDSRANTAARCSTNLQTVASPGSPRSEDREHELEIRIWLAEHKLTEADLLPAD